jgi:hypothetical protein
MDEIAAILSRLREFGEDIAVYCPAGEDTIREPEDAFGHPMPPTYRAFLGRFGAFSIGDRSFGGIIDGKLEEGRGWAWSETLSAREESDLPAHYLVVHSDEDGFICLDFSRIGADGERPVVYHFPFRRTPFHELGPNYGAWLIGRLSAMAEK